MALLFTPLKMGAQTLPNRICVPPMCCCLAREGVGSDELIAHYEKLAASGAGLVVIEATAVRADGRITTRCLGLYNDEQERFFKRLLKACRAVAPAETKFFLQLSHCGRKGSRKDPKTGHGTLLPEEGGFALMAPSAIAYTPHAPMPREMTEADIDQMLQAFEAAAHRAAHVGFDGIQIHAAHGYLVHQMAVDAIAQTHCLFKVDFTESIQPAGLGKTLGAHVNLKRLPFDVDNRHAGTVNSNRVAHAHFFEMKILGRNNRQTNAVAKLFGFTRLADGLNNSGKHIFFFS